MRKIPIDSKDAWIVVVIVFFAAIGLLLHAENAFDEEMRKGQEHLLLPSEPAGGQGFAWVEIDFDGKKKRKFEGDVDGKRYSLELALRQAAEAGKFDFEIKKGAVKEIDGVGESGRWDIYRNGALVSESISALTIERGDTYTLRYKK